MGWSSVTKLEVEPWNNNPGDHDPRLWTRGGLEGLAVTVGSSWIHIPRDAILGLVADEYRGRKIRELEGMTTSEIINRILDVRTAPSTPATAPGRACG